MKSLETITNVTSCIARMFIISYLQKNQFSSVSRIKENRIACNNLLDMEINYILQITAQSL